MHLAEAPAKQCAVIVMMVMIVIITIIMIIMIIITIIIMVIITKSMIATKEEACSVGTE